MAITINDLRVDWLKQIEAYDATIEMVRREGLIELNNVDAGKATRLWVNLVHKWRAELIQLLSNYPEQC